MAAPLLVPLILLGGATIALVASSGKKSPPPQPAGQTYTLDAIMPVALRDQVLAALATEQDPTRLESFAFALGAHYPLSASALRTKAAMLRGMQPMPVPVPVPVPAPVPPQPSPAPAVPHPVPGAPPSPAAPATTWQELIGQLATQNDPDLLEAYARQLDATNPMAAAILRAREAVLRGIAPHAQVQPVPSPAPPAPPAPLPPSPSPSPAPPAPLPPSPSPSPTPPAPIPPAPPAPTPPSPIPPAPDPTPPAPSPGVLPPSPAPSQPPLVPGLDPGMPADMQRAVAGALMTETDPAKLEGFATAIQGQYPLAAALLRAKAQALRALPLPVPVVPAGPFPVPVIPVGPFPVPVGPSPAPPSPSLPTLGTYTVQSGDFPTKIAQKLTGSGNRWRELVSANPQKKTAADGNFASLLPGEVLKLPATWGAPRPPSPLPSPSPSPAPVLPVIAPTGDGTYKVQAGDFPTKIAQKLTGNGNRWRELVAANPQKKTAADGNFASLLPGEVLKLPASWSAVYALPAAAKVPALPAGGNHASHV